MASYCILQLLEKGYQVRTTIRDVKRADNVRRVLQNGGATEEAVNSIQFFAAELGKDDGWQEACTGCTYVLHVASPFPLKNPKHEDELIIPAREGTLRALRAAKAAGTVKRVVVTSSFAAVCPHDVNDRFASSLNCTDRLRSPRSERTVHREGLDRPQGTCSALSQEQDRCRASRLGLDRGDGLQVRKPSGARCCQPRCCVWTAS